MKQSPINRFFRISLQAVIVLVLMLAYYINITFLISGLNDLKDFGSFFASGQFAAQGKNPYSSDSPLIFSVVFPKIDHSGSAPNLNPPVSVLIFEQIAKTPPTTSVYIWRISSAILYLYILHVLIHSYNKSEASALGRSIWMFGLAGFWHTIELGQIYIFLLLLATGVIIVSEKNKPVLAGIMLGILIAIKPNFIFWAFALGIAGYWNIFFSAGITSLFISFIPVYFYGITIYKQWLEASRIFTPDLLIFPGNISLQGLTARFGSAEAGIAISFILVLLVVLIIYKYKPAVSNINKLAIITSLLISPIAWTGYILFLLPGLMMVKKWGNAEWIAAVIFSVPFYVILIFFQNNFFNFVFFGWFYGWGLLLLLFSGVKASIRL